MITRQDIENEAAFVQHLIEISNPTGGKHTPTPWRKGPDADLGVPLNEQINDAAVLSSFLKWSGSHPLYSMLDGQGTPLALFKRKADRDLALYFANTHAAIVGMLRGEADAWDFACKATSNTDFQSYATARADNLRVYADLFCRLGAPEEDLGVKPSS